MKNFWNGFVKQAEENPEGHKVRRFFLGNPISAAIEAKKGKKLDAFGNALKHNAISIGKGIGIGGAGGALLGAGVGALTGNTAGGAGIGAGIGAYGGMAGMGIKSHLDEKASRIHGEYSKHRKEAEESPEGHKVRRFLLGNPISAAIEARKGSKLKAYGNAVNHNLVSAAKGATLGGAGGALLGLGASALSKGRITPGAGAGIGGFFGGVGGMTGMGVKSHLDEKASRIHGEYSKHKE